MPERIEREQREADSEKEIVWKADLAPPAHPEFEFVTAEDGGREQTSERGTQRQTHSEYRSSHIFSSYQHSMEEIVAVPLGQFTQFQTDLTDFVVYEMEQAMAAQRQNVALIQSVYTDFMQMMAHSTRMGVSPLPPRKEYRKESKRRSVDTATDRATIPPREATAKHSEEVEISEADTAEQQKITPTESN